MKPKFITSPEANRRIAELEALVAKGSPVTNSASPTASAAAVAVKARLDAAKASFAAAEAKAHAKLTAAALQPATVTAAQYLASIERPRMSRAEFSQIPHAKRGEVIKQITLIP